jgi:hypothetical protein
MNYNSLTSVMSRVFTFGTLALIALAVIESVANSLSYSLVHEAYRPGRLAEFAAMSAVIASMLRLRQIREELCKKS